MIPAQTQLYRRTWSDAAKAHGWTDKAGVAAAVQAHHGGAVWVSPELNHILSIIYEAALISAQTRACGLVPEAVKNDDALDMLAEGLGCEVCITADDLRRACSLFATGRNASSKSYSNADFDKVLALLRLLADPQNLRNLAAFQDGGEAGQRRRHVHVIASADAPYWQRIAKDRFGHADLDRLSLEQLRQLSLTIRSRRSARAVKAIQPDLLAA